METSQGVDTSVEKEEETQDVENEQNESENVLNSKPISNMSESSSMEYEGGGKWSTTMNLSSKQSSAHLPSLTVRKREFPEQTRDSVFTFDSCSLDQSSSTELIQPITLRTRSLSKHNICSPRERKKAPSSPIHKRLRPSKMYSYDINSSGKSPRQERSSLFASLQPNSSYYNIDKALSSEISPSYDSLANSIPESNIVTNYLSSSLSEIPSSASTQIPEIPPLLDSSLRSSKSEISQNTQPFSSVSSIKVKPRRKQPSVTVSWIVPKTASIRNTWTSRSNTSLSITLTSPTSPVSSPLQGSGNSVDIVVKPSNYYFRRKQRYSLNNPSYNPPSSLNNKDPSPSDSSSSDQPSTNQSISPFDTESYRSSWISESLLLPFSSSSRLLNVSYDLSEEELQPPKDAVYEKIILTNQKRFSIFPTQNKDDDLITIDLCDDLIDTSDFPSAGAIPKTSCESELNGLDFSTNSKFSAETPVLQSPENNEEMIEEYDNLMKEETAKKQQVAWDGEELQGGEVNSDENMIDDDYLGKRPSSSKSIIECPSISLPTSPITVNNHKIETPVTESTIYRETSPMPVSGSTSPIGSPVSSPVSSPIPDKTSASLSPMSPPMSSPIPDKVSASLSPMNSPMNSPVSSPVSSPIPDTASLSPSHHSKKSTSHFLNGDDNILNLPADNLIFYYNELDNKSVLISPLSTPLPPTPNSIESSSSTPVSPPTSLTPAASVIIPESYFSPTSQQLDRAHEFAMEFKRKQEKKEKEEKELREDILLRAKQVSIIFKYISIVSS